MRPLRYSINMTLDGCCDQLAIIPDKALHRHAANNISRADCLLLGRVTYEMVEVAWRLPVAAGVRPDWMKPFARKMEATWKHVVSSTLQPVDWNAELVRRDLRTAVDALKHESGAGLLVGGETLPLAPAELDLIDEYKIVVQPPVAGRGPTLLAVLSMPLDLQLMDRVEVLSGAVALRHVPRF